MPTENPLIAKALERARETWERILGTLRVEHHLTAQDRAERMSSIIAAALLRAQTNGLLSAGEPPQHKCNGVYRQRMEQELAALLAAAKELEART